MRKYKRHHVHLTENRRARELELSSVVEPELIGAEILRGSNRLVAGMNIHFGQFCSVENNWAEILKKPLTTAAWH